MKFKLPRKAFIQALLAGALAIGLIAPAAADYCHGHSTDDGHWDLNARSWSYAEMQEIQKLHRVLKEIDPYSKTTGLMMPPSSISSSAKATARSARMRPFNL